MIKYFTFLLLLLSCYNHKIEEESRGLKKNKLPENYNNLAFFEKFNSINLYKCTCDDKDLELQYSIIISKNHTNPNVFGVKFFETKIGENLYFDSLYYSGNSLYYSNFNLYYKVKEILKIDNQELINETELFRFCEDCSFFSPKNSLFMGDSIYVKSQKLHSYIFQSSISTKIISNPIGFYKFEVDTIYGIQEFVYSDGFEIWNCVKEIGRVSK